MLREHVFVSTTHLSIHSKKKKLPLRNGAAIKHEKCQIVDQIPWTLNHRAHWTDETRSIAKKTGLATSPCWNVDKTIKTVTVSSAWNLQWTEMCCIFLACVCQANVATAIRLSLQTLWRSKGLILASWRSRSCNTAFMQAQVNVKTTNVKKIARAS